MSMDDPPMEDPRYGQDVERERVALANARAEGFALCQHAALMLVGDPKWGGAAFRRMDAIQELKQWDFDSVVERYEAEARNAEIDECLKAVSECNYAVVDLFPEAGPCVRRDEVVGELEMLKMKVR